MELDYINVAEAKKKQFAAKEITSIEDLIKYIPRDYVDYSKETAFIPGNECCLKVECLNVKYHNGAKPFVTAECYYRPADKNIRVTWFNQPFMYQKAREMSRLTILLCGKITMDNTYGTFQCVNPRIFTDDIASSMRIYPIYSKIRGMSDNYLIEKLKEALRVVKFSDAVPDDIKKRYAVVDINTAYKNLHFPKTMQDVEDGRKRLVFDNLLYFALEMEAGSRIASKGSQYNIKSLEAYNKVIESIPYELTDDQKNVLKDMISNIKEGKRLSALLQGDVSCGKSIVAFLMAAAVAGSGYQAAIMAPTQVLARQHYEDIRKLMENTGIKCAYYEGYKMKAKERREMIEGIKSGDIGIIIGTHSLLGKDIEYKDLALTIVDEEHKFGVLQKQALTEKASAGVHSITMSATPIPRSLSQVLYGDSTQIYTIKQMPPGRQKVKSCVYNKKNVIFNFMRKELNQGHQIYVVCPAIDKKEDKESRLRTVTEIYEEYSKEFVGYNVGSLTGKNKKEEVAEILKQFNEGKINILVSTTVVEVGVNVPNATVMAIENAENFGLAGLHQLRGRVGRGSSQGYCVLISDDLENERLKTIVETTDGFKIAEKDLAMRGTGEFIGTKQSGDDKYISLIMSDLRNRDMYLKLKDDAADIYDSGTCKNFLAEKESEE